MKPDTDYSNINNSTVIYDFCLDWQMSYIDRETLVSEFRRSGMNFNLFKNFATKNGWYVESMKVLGEKQ